MLFALFTLLSLSMPSFLLDRFFIGAEREAAQRIKTTRTMGEASPGIEIVPEPLTNGRLGVPRGERCVHFTSHVGNTTRETLGNY